MLAQTILTTASQFPDRLCYRCGEETLTYGELARAAKRLALHLIGDSRPVLVYGESSPLMLIGFVGCLLAGRPYLPCEPSFPVKRLLYLAKEANAPLVLNTLPQLTGLEEFLPVLCLERFREGPIPDLLPAEGDFPVYLLFTSGSTGIPKGVPVYQSNLLHFLDWILALPGFSAALGDYLIGQARFSFDLSVCNLYVSLFTGRCMVMIPKEEQDDYSKHLRDSSKVVVRF